MDHGVWGHQGDSMEEDVGRPVPSPVLMGPQGEAFGSTLSSPTPSPRTRQAQGKSTELPISMSSDSGEPGT